MTKVENLFFIALAFLIISIFSFSEVNFVYPSFLNKQKDWRNSIWYQNVHTGKQFEFDRAQVCIIFSGENLIQKILGKSGYLIPIILGQILRMDTKNYLLFYDIMWILHNLF